MLLIFFFFFSLTAQFVGSSESVGDPMTQKKRQKTGGTKGISKFVLINVLCIKFFNVFLSNRSLKLLIC